MAARSNARAALLAATMNLVPPAPVDIARFLRIPAIVMTLRNAVQLEASRLCRETSCAAATRRRRRA